MHSPHKHSSSTGANACALHPYCGKSARVCVWHPEVACMRAHAMNMHVSRFSKFAHLKGRCSPPWHTASFCTCALNPQIAFVGCSFVEDRYAATVRLPFPQSARNCRLVQVEPACTTNTCLIRSSNEYCGVCVAAEVQAAPRRRFRIVHMHRCLNFHLSLSWCAPAVA